MSDTKPKDGETQQGVTLHSARTPEGPDEIARASTQLVATSEPAHVQLEELELEEDTFETRYEMRAILGKGGMGEVHVCRDRRIGREVAFKVVREGFSERLEMKARFLREARVQGQLEHPAIVPVYDLGRAPDGEPYFTMKRVRGSTLDKLLELLRAGDEDAKKKYSVRRLLTAMSSVCLALEFVHGRGVVHRDLKPSNIMLGDFGEVYLLDWGLAKILGASETRDESVTDGGVSEERIASAPSGLTSAGSLLGTPGYMPREQLVGHLLDLDGRADVYSLGAILFELLTLERLHVGETLQQVLRSTLDGADARASVRAPSRDVPPELEAICVRATATAAAERYASAREMGDAIDRYLDGDRDIQQRREMATRHAEAAEKASALDPDNPQTMRAMLRLLMQPPRELPNEVKEELEQLSRDQVRLGGRTGGLAYLSMNLYVPILVLMGIRSPWMWGTYALAVATGLVSFGIARLAQPRTRHAMLVLVLSLVCIATMSATFGPFIVVPAVAATSALVYSTTNDRSLRALIIGLACLTVLVPYGLELAGLLPPSMRFTAEGILLLPRVVWFPPLASQVFLVASSVAVIVTSGLALAPFRNELDDAQRRIRLLAWHLRQLVPGEAIAPSPGSTRGGAS